MNEKDWTDFQEELRVLTEKYGVKDAAFCGDADGKLIGFAVSRELPAKSIVGVVMNVGRLWQHFRGVLWDVLDEFEKPRKE
jgi:hypothetical protein